ncbi:hypothetical protein P4S68_09335 [Pseudoalteromonas sp. Hal099]
MFDLYTICLQFDYNRLVGFKVSLGMVRVGILTVFFFCALFSPLTYAYTLNNNITLEDDNLWRPVTAFNAPPSAQQVITSYKNASETSNLLGKSGAVVTKIALNNPTTGDWYVLPQANFIDVGLAYWQTEQGI